MQRFHPDKEILLWPGYCPTHHDISVQDLKELKRQHPQAKLMVHPECTPEVIDMADHVSSTEGMIKFAKNDQAKEFIVGTEVDMTYRLRKEVPGKTFIPVPTAVCPNMKRTTLSSIDKGPGGHSPRRSSLLQR